MQMEGNFSKHLWDGELKDKYGLEEIGYDDKKH